MQILKLTHCFLIFIACISIYQHTLIGYSWNRCNTINILSTDMHIYIFIYLFTRDGRCRIFYMLLLLYYKCRIFRNSSVRHIRRVITDISSKNWNLILVSVVRIQCNKKQFFRRNVWQLTEILWKFKSVKGKHNFSKINWIFPYKIYKIDVVFYFRFYIMNAKIYGSKSQIKYIF